MQDKIATEAELVKRNFLDPENGDLGLCPFCLANLYDLLCWWVLNKFKYMEQGCWEICFYTIIWSIWIERNHIIFRNKIYEEGILVDNIKTKIAMWLKACYDLKDKSVEDIRRGIEGIRKLKVSKIQVV